MTSRIRLYPFTLAECEQYAEERCLGLDRLQLATCYMVFGGVAYYWSLLQRGKSADQNIDRLFFGPQDGLRDEFEELYSSLFSDSRPYEAIVRALGSRRTGLRRDELLKALGKTSGGDLTRHLVELEECGFIRRYHNGAVAVAATARPCYCKYCGYKANSVSTLTAGKCLRHPNGSLKGWHSPAL